MQSTDILRMRRSEYSVIRSKGNPKPEEQSNSGILEDKVVASECDNSNDVAACAETQTNESKEIEMEPKEDRRTVESNIPG